MSACDILNLLPLSGCLFEFSSPLYHILVGVGGTLLNFSNRSVNIMGKTIETWNAALITTLIYRGQSLSACGGTWPFLHLHDDSVIRCTLSLKQCIEYNIYSTPCLYKGKRCMMKVKQHSEWLSNRKIYQRAKINEISIMAPFECWRYWCTES